VSRNDGLRGHAYYLELAGRRPGGPWLWFVFAAMMIGGLVETLTHVAR
jgi:hypothetical protein